MEYRFTRMYRGYEVGTSVPKDYTPGVIDALLRRGIIELVKNIDAPPMDKMIKRTPKRKCLTPRN